MRKRKKWLWTFLLALGLVQGMTVQVFADTMPQVQTDSDAVCINTEIDDAIFETIELDMEFDLDSDSEIMEDLPNNDELFTGFFEQQLYEIPSGGISVFGNFGEMQLTGAEKIAYKALKSQIIKIANGDQSSTKIQITAGKLGYDKKKWTAAELGVSTIIEDGKITNEAKTALLNAIGIDHERIRDLLLVNCPYELYWFDKEAKMTISGMNTVQVTAVGESIGLILDEDDVFYTYPFAVSEDYRDADMYHVDTEKVNIAIGAAEKAKEIIRKYKGNGDLVKLQGYAKEICDLVSYNSDITSAGTDYVYGDPWQVVYVFDDDPNTSVVCEGYAKAFQYLCDLSIFDRNITSYLVTGEISDETRNVRHMWNIVTMEDGKNYLVDITNCDEGTIGYPSKLFIAHAQGSAESGYTLAMDGTSIQYKYDVDTISMYGDERLSLSSTQYVSLTNGFRIVRPNDYVTYGDQIQFEIADGDGGTVSWSTSDEKVASIGSDGTLKANYIGLVTITAVEAASGGGQENRDTYTFEIQPKELAVEAISIKDKRYDGTTIAERDESSEIIVLGALEGDELQIVVKSAVFADQKAGVDKTVKVTAELEGEKAECYTLGKITAQADILPTPLLIKANHVSMEAGEGKPNYTATATGLVGTDSLTKITFSDNAGDGKTKGNYQILPISVNISGGNENYEITFEPGTLTISLTTKSISNAIALANHEKNGVIVSDKSASAISKGTKFVSAEEMKALEQAIQYAEDQIARITDLDQMQALLSMLNQEITTFKAAVQVGTKKSSGGGGGGGGGGSSSGGGGGSSSGGSKKTAQVATADGVFIDTSSNKTGTWTNDAVGRWFRYSDGTWPVGKWLELSRNGQQYWYHFNASGYLTTGWILDGGIWYYLNPVADQNQGQMCVGWQQINGVWYYLNPMAGQRPLGAMYCNEMTPDGYYVDATGAWR